MDCIDIKKYYYGLLLPSSGTYQYPTTFAGFEEQVNISGDIIHGRNREEQDTRLENVICYQTVERLLINSQCQSLKSAVSWPCLEMAVAALKKT